MKKLDSKKLGLSSHTLRTLTIDQLGQVIGGRASSGRPTTNTVHELSSGKPTTNYTV
jgi:hypothetical protein